jgi:hypothetical protein
MLTFLASLNPLFAQSFRGLIINEYLIDIGKVQPGEVVTRSFQVKYDYQPLADGSARIANIKTYSQNFTQADEPGMPKFLEEGTLEPEESLADWITFSENSFTMDGLGQTHNVTFTITVPTNAEPGSKQAAVFLQDMGGDAAFEDLKNQNKTGSALKAALGPLVFLTVDGDLKSSLVVEDIYTTNIKGKKHSFFFNPPVNVVVALKNDGNTYLSPRGRVIIHEGEKFTDGQLASFELNETGGRVLPGTTRNFTFTWDDSFINTVKTEIPATDQEKSKVEYNTKYDWDKLSKLRIGKYNVTVQFDYRKDDGTSSEVFIGSTSFRVFPWQLILLILLVILLVTFYISRKVRKSGK